MKKLCTFLIELNMQYYFLAIMLFGILVFSQVRDVDKMVPEFIWSRAILVFFGLCFANFFAMHFFYSNEELEEHKMNGNIIMHAAFVVNDKYFQVKINTDISLAKRVSGYIYVISTRLFTFASGYFLSMILCGLVTKLWVG